MSRLPIYLDYHATTPVDRRVLDRMLPYFTELFGNPASSGRISGAGRRRKRWSRRGARSPPSSAPRRARSYFTSGATESNNLAIQGVVPSRRLGAPSRRGLGDRAQVGARGRARRSSGRAGACTVAAGAARRTHRPRRARARGRRHGHGVRQRHGREQRDRRRPAARGDWRDRARRRRGLSCRCRAGASARCRWTSNAHARSICCRSRATRCTGRRAAARSSCASAPRSRRSSSAAARSAGCDRARLNVPGIVGLGAACEICQREMAGRSARVRRLRDRLLDGLQRRDRRRDRQRIARASAAEQPARQFPRRRRRVAAHRDRRHRRVVRIGVQLRVSDAVARATRHHGRPMFRRRRFGSDLGRFTTDDEIDYAIEKFATVVRHLRGVAPASRS